MIDTVECPKCGVMIEWDETVETETAEYKGHEGLNEYCYGHCPKCRMKYEWTNFYQFVTSHSLYAYETDAD
jgi:endogenous inhibitor of DNA gyrase (YacG/DUF329 family)